MIKVSHSLLLLNVGSLFNVYKKFYGPFVKFTNTQSDNYFQSSLRHYIFSKSSTGVTPPRQVQYPSFLNKWVLDVQGRSYVVDLSRASRTPKSCLSRPFHSLIFCLLVCDLERNFFLDLLWEFLVLNYWTVPVEDSQDYTMILSRSLESFFYV